MIKISVYSLEGICELDQNELSKAAQLPTAWVDLTNPTEKELQLIQDIFKLHPLSIEDVMHRGQRPKVEDYEDYLFTVLHFLKHTDSEITFDEISLFLGRWLISVHYGEMKILEDLSKVAKLSLSKIQVQGPFFLYHIIVDRVVDSYFSILDEIEDKIVRLEELVEESPSKKLFSEIDDLRKNLTSIRRSLWPVREMLGSLMKGIFPLVTDQNIAYVRDTYDHLAQLIDLVEIYHSRVNSIGELYLSSISASTNEAIKIFTILATIFLPPTLIASIYGMNFRYLPELSFRWGYPFSLLLMFLVAFIPWIYLKRKKVI